MSKLVRDKIPDIIEQKDGFRPPFHIVDWEELLSALDTKLDEEISELHEALNDPVACAEEIADVMEVLLAIAQQKGFSFEEIENIRRAKGQKRGGFERGIILEKW